jgi:hypothetical protein
MADANQKAPAESVQEDRVANPDPNALIQNMRALSIEVNDEAKIESAVEAVLDGHQPSVVVEVSPDVLNEETQGYADALRESSDAYSAPIIQKAKTPFALFPKWFHKNAWRMSIIAVEFTVVGGEKSWELLKTPMPVSFTSAMLAGIATGGVVGTLDWNVKKIMSFITANGAFTTQFFANLSDNAGNPKVRAVLNQFLNEGWQFFKNTVFINAPLFEVMKIIIFATNHAHGGLFQRSLQSFEQVAPGDFSMALGLAFKATAVSFPTTKVIGAWYKKALGNAGTDETKLGKIQNWLTLFVSTAISARAVLFGMKVMAHTASRPDLITYSNIGLYSMLTWSVYTWKIAPLVARYQCNKKLKGLAPASANSELPAT